MRARSSEAFATRLPAQEAEQIEEAIEDTGWSKSDFVRHAIRYYVSRNPDDIPSLYPDHSISRLLAEMEDEYA
jgi:predicted DNA-binding protein